MTITRTPHNSSPACLSTRGFRDLSAKTVAAYHIPVLTDEIAKLARNRRRFVDCTVGGGGHATVLLRGGGDLLAIDRDPEALETARRVVPGDHVRWLNRSFVDQEALEAIRAFRPDLVLFDLGVSGRQLDSDERGFSFRPDVPLDMRMGSGDKSAADLLNDLPQKSLASIFAEGADERRARRLAAAVARRRQRSTFRISDDLVNTIRSVLGSRSGPSDFARIFQALRIAVNSEIESLQKSLPVVQDALVQGGAVAVISYHSGEDRVVKRHFQEWARSCICKPGLPVCTCRGRALGRMEPKKPIQPTDDEIANNSRARSAKLRVFVKSDAC